MMRPHMAPPSKFRRWFRDGSVQLGRWWGIPVRFHWTLPIGMLVLTRFRVMPVAWASIASLVLVHELGHAWFVRRYRARVESVQLNAFGGLCTYSGEVDEVESSIIAWGGVLAQAIVLALTSLLVAIFGQPHDPRLAEVTFAFTEANLWMMGLNLLPVPPLDGHLAWRLPFRSLVRWLYRREVKRMRAAIRALKREDPASVVVLAPPAEPTGVRVDALSEPPDEPVPPEVVALVDQMWKDARKPPRT
jgi:Zn-dependent protease